MKLFSRSVWLIVVLLALALAGRMALGGAPVLGAAFAAAALFAAWVYNSRRTHAARYLLPGLATFAVFVLMPLLYTVYIAFTNFSGTHLLDRGRVRAWFAQDTYEADGTYLPFRLHAADEGRWQLVVPLDRAEFGRNRLVSRPFTEEEAASGTPIPLGLNTTPPSGERAGIRDIVAAQPWLAKARFAAPGEPVPLVPVSLRALAPRLPRWSERPDGTLSNAVTGQLLVPDDALGNYVDASTREPVGPGWRVWVGGENFRSLFADPALRAPFLRIFGWNVAFAFLSVAITFAVGVLLACLLQWKALRGRAIYRTLLILPYAIPAFIPILVFRGLFNENFGEINALLSAFGLSPHWFTAPWMARLMILIVNTWLGYPYMLIISSGMLQAVPDDLYEATAIDGAGPWTNFYRITLPQIFPPLFPLLIASFAFNFNNFSLIYLLTGGKPDIPGSATVAGSTDLLVSYTFRMAFKDSAARFGFASAVATLLFIVVALLAWQQLRFSAKTKAPARG